MMSSAARKKADPCFPAVYGLISARVYHGKRIISTELDAQTGTGGAPATGQRPNPGLGQGGSIGTSFQCRPAHIPTAEAEYQTGGRRIY